MKDTSELLFLIKVGELMLKGGNRPFFEKKLRDNIKRKFRGHRIEIISKKGRFYLKTFGIEKDLVKEKLSSTFGIVGFSETISCEKTIDAVRKTVLSLVESRGSSDLSTDRSEGESFKIEARRSDKSFPLTSYELAADLGSAVLAAFPKMRVDVKKPDLVIHVEIRENAFIYGHTNKGPGGLPVGIAGRGLLLLSGGIDSPVAGYLMAKRGLKLDAVYFHTYPYTSDEAKDKVITLARKLSPWLGGLNLLVVPFTRAQMRIKERAREEEVTILMRACMVRIAHLICGLKESSCLVTGEALSQVASQTVESIRFTGSYTDLPVFRPLIGMDKEEIIKISRAIDTFETSILPYDDCCVLFSPKHPVVRPNMGESSLSFQKLEIEDLLEQAAREAERIYLPLPGTENIVTETG